MLGKRGQLAGYEALIILVLLGTTIGLGYLYAKKPSENSIYQAESKPVIYEVKPTWFGCASWGAEQRRLNERTTNSQINSSH